jgi:hypothetical protein
MVDGEAAASSTAKSLIQRDSRVTDGRSLGGGEVDESEERSMVVDGEEGEDGDEAVVEAATEKQQVPVKTSRLQTLFARRAQQKEAAAASTAVVAPGRVKITKLSNATPGEEGEAKTKEKNKLLGKVREEEEAEEMGKVMAAMLEESEDETMKKIVKAILGKKSTYKTSIYITSNDKTSTATERRHTQLESQNVDVYKRR